MGINLPISKTLGLPIEMASAGRVPSEFNGKLFEGPQGLFIIAAAIATSALELATLDNVEGLTPTGYVAGDLGWDPLSLLESNGSADEMRLREIKHGRLAMLAITGFAVQEFLYGKPVVEQTPFFFQPSWPF